MLIDCINPWQNITTTTHCSCFATLVFTNIEFTVIKLVQNVMEENMRGGFQEMSFQDLEALLETCFLNILWNSVALFDPFNHSAKE